MNDTNAPSQLVPIALNVIASAFGAVGQFFYRRGSLQMSTVPLWKNFDLAIGGALFFGVMILFVVAYKLGGKMSVVYPFYATTFIWSTLIAVKYVGERVSTLQWLGIVTVVVGTALVALGQASTNP